MSKIYGFKQSDILELAEYVKKNQNKSKTKVFSEFAIMKNKAKGTIRNMYYALAKHSKTDENLQKICPSNKPISVNKIEAFTLEQEKDLVKNVLTEKAKGKSVRSAILKLADGDIRLALRLQNKYRNSLKSNPQLFNSVIQEINGKGYNFPSENYSENPFKEKQISGYIKEEQLSKLKKEIDGLIDKISSRLKKENVHLKERISFLELENLRLNNILYSSQGQLVKENKLINYFTPKTSKELPN